MLVGTLFQFSTTRCEKKFRLTSRLAALCLRFIGPVASVADPWHFGVDPDPDLDPRIHASELMDPYSDPDPAIFVIDFQDANKKLIFLKKVFLLITFWRYIYIIFKDKKSKRSRKVIKGFLTIFAWW